jgi:hypothetical protein
LKYIATAAAWFSTFFENASRKSLREQLQEIVHDYMRKFGVDAVALDTVAEWAGAYLAVRERATTREFLAKLARPAGLEPATPGLEAQ